MPCRAATEGDWANLPPPRQGDFPLAANQQQADRRGRVVSGAGCCHRQNCTLSGTAAKSSRTGRALSGQNCFGSGGHMAKRQALLYEVQGRAPGHQCQTPTATRVKLSNG